MNGHPDRAKRLAAVAAAHDDWAQAHAGNAVFDPVRARKKPGSDYNLHYLDVSPPGAAEEDFHRRVDRAASGHAHANDSEAVDVATATMRRMPAVRGAADVQLSRTAPGKITAMHKSSGMKIGMIAPKGNGYAGTHADGTGTGASGSQQGALTGLIAYHNQQAQQGGVAVMPGSKTYTAGAGAAVDLAGSLPVSTPASSASDGPKVTSIMGAGGGSSGAPAGLSPYAQGVYRKLLAKKLKPGVALMFAKRADAMHEKDAGGKASAA